MSEVITYKCELKDGIHARPAGYIERLCNSFKAEVVWENKRTGLKGNAKSALSLVATDTLLNDACEIIIHGEDARDAASQFNALLKKLPSLDVSQPEEAAPQAGYLPRSLRETQLSFIQGSRISGGVAIAKPLVIQSLTFEEMLARHPVKTCVPEQEKMLFLNGLEILKNEKQTSLETTAGVEHDIMQAHLSIITDVTFQGSIIEYINENKSAWSSIILAAMDFCDILNRSSSKYI